MNLPLISNQPERSTPNISKDQKLPKIDRFRQGAPSVFLPETEPMDDSIFSNPVQVSLMSGKKLKTKDNAEVIVKRFMNQNGRASMSPHVRHNSMAQ